MSKEAKVGYKKNIGTILFAIFLPAQLFMDCHIFDHITMIRIRQCIT